MKKYIITSPKFAGEIHVLYGVDSRLLFIDFMKASLTDEQIEYFKSKLPVVYDQNFSQAFGTSKLMIVEEGYTVTFDMFWNRYDHKVNRIRAEKEWNKLSEADQVNAFARYPLYDRHLKLNAWKTKAGPDRYLKDRFWESEWK